MDVERVRQSCRSHAALLGLFSSRADPRGHEHDRCERKEHSRLTRQEDPRVLRVRLEATVTKPIVTLAQKSTSPLRIRRPLACPVALTFGHDLVPPAIQPAHAARPLIPATTKEPQPVSRRPTSRETPLPLKSGLPGSLSRVFAGNPRPDPRGGARWTREATLGPLRRPITPLDQNDFGPTKLNNPQERDRLLRFAVATALVRSFKRTSARKIATGQICDPQSTNSPTMVISKRRSIPIVLLLPRSPLPSSRFRKFRPPSPPVKLDATSMSNIRSRI